MREKRRRGMARALLCLLLLTTLLSPVYAQAEGEGGCATCGKGSQNAQGTDDLLELDLEQLMMLDVVQVTVPGAHWHWEGDWMVGLSHMHLEQNGNLQGTTSVSDAQVLAQYPTIHTSMQMDMTMLMVMYGVSDDVTLNFMLPYTTMSMPHVNRAGQRFTTHSSGFGDISLTAITPLFDDYPHRVQVEAGITLPTGSIDVRDATPSGPNTLLEYPMQLGSGSVDLIGAVTYLGNTDAMNWGLQTRGLLHPYRNARGWSPGDNLTVTGWISPRVTDDFSPSFRLRGQTWGNVRGQDPELNPTANPNSNPRLQSGTRLDALLGINFSLGVDDEGHGHRFSIEGGVPIYQNLAGPQLRTDWMLSGAWNWTF